MKRRDPATGSCIRLRSIIRHDGISPILFPRPSHICSTVNEPSQVFPLKDFDKCRTRRDYSGGGWELLLAFEVLGRRRQNPRFLGLATLQIELKLGSEAPFICFGSSWTITLQKSKSEVMIFLAGMVQPSYSERLIALHKRIRCIGTSMQCVRIHQIH
jgi:hypothetical protein